MLTHSTSDGRAGSLSRTDISPVWCFNPEYVPLESAAEA